MLIHRENARLHQGSLASLAHLHAQVDDVALHVHTTAACSALHLLGDERGQSRAHVAAEDARAEGHVDSVGKGVIGEDDCEETLLCEDLHPPAVAGEANLRRANKVRSKLSGLV